MSRLHKVVRSMADRVLPATLWLWFLYRNALGIAAYKASPSGAVDLVRLLLVAAFNLLVVYLFLARRPISGARSQPLGILAAFLGTFVPPFAGLFSVTRPSLALAGALISTLGMVWSLAALLSLGRCLGILPEARGLVTRGPYALVRHPLYLGHIVTTLGLVLPALSVTAALFWLGTVALQLWRAHYEERALAAAFAEYDHYRRRTKAIIPFLF
ncbi:MAG: methyltransferase family protein [Anaerolineae bacterium]